MKFWLYDLLACPIDKYFPLNLYIFSYETKIEDINDFVDRLKKRNIESIEKENIVTIDKKNDEIFIRDEIILEKTRIDRYLQLLINSINEFEHIYDKSPNQSAKTCLKIIKEEIKQAFENNLENITLDKIRELFPEIYFLNKVKLSIEIESGVIFCPNCKRWYPIIETIPQMLPDEFRKEEEEIKFLKSIRHLLKDEFFKQDLKPYSL